MIVLYALLALFFWVWLIGIIVTSPIWLAGLFVHLSGKSWKQGESAGASDVPPQPKQKAEMPQWGDPSFS